MSASAMAEHMKTHAAEDIAARPGAAVAGPDVVVKVNGLVCDFCARSLEKTFRKTGKVAGVSVDLTAKEVRLQVRRRRQHRRRHHPQAGEGRRLCRG